GDEILDVPQLAADTHQDALGIVEHFADELELARNAPDRRAESHALHPAADANFHRDELRIAADALQERHGAASQRSTRLYAKSAIVSASFQRRGCRACGLISEGYTESTDISINYANYKRTMQSHQGRRRRPSSNARRPVSLKRSPCAGPRVARSRDNGHLCPAHGRQSRRPNGAPAPGAVRGAQTLPGRTADVGKAARRETGRPAADRRRVIGTKVAQNPALAKHLFRREGADVSACPMRRDKGRPEGASATAGARSAA